MKTHRTEIAWLHRAFDMIIPFVILALSTKIYSVPWQDRYTLLGLLGSLVFISSAQILGIYKNWRERPVITNIQMTLNAWLMTWVFLVVLAFLFKDSSNYSRGVLLIWAVFTPLTFISYRIIIRFLLGYYRKNGGQNRRIAIIGAGKIGKHLFNVIQQNKWLGYQVVGFYDDNTNLIGSKINDIPILGDTRQLTPDAGDLKFDEAFLCLPITAETKIKQLLNELADTTAVVKYIPDMFTFDLIHAKWTDIKGIPVVSVYDTPLHSTGAKAIKSIEDILASILILIIISPILLATAIGVKLSSPGPIIFKQKRYGLNGKEIKVYKFRSMTCQDNGDIVNQATKNDPRITPFGAFIRKTSLDELPQFINVLQGKMSIVGPRPHANIHNEQYRKLVPKYMQRHLVKPGITGWAQINGWRGETDTLEKMEKRIEFDLHYINNWSLWLDIKIIVLTMFKGFINKNAY